MKTYLLMAAMIGLCVQLCARNTFTGTLVYEQRQSGTGLQLPEGVPYLKSEKIFHVKGLNAIQPGFITIIYRGDSNQIVMFYAADRLDSTKAMTYTVFTPEEGRAYHRQELAQFTPTDEKGYDSLGLIQKTYVATVMLEGTLESSIKVGMNEDFSEYMVNFFSTCEGLKGLPISVTSGTEAFKFETMLVKKEVVEIPDSLFFIPSNAQAIPYEQFVKYMSDQNSNPQRAIKSNDPQRAALKEVKAPTDENGNVLPVDIDYSSADFAPKITNEAKADEADGIHISMEEAITKVKKAVDRKKESKSKESSKDDSQPSSKKKRKR